jgi:histidinol-phosphate aminotransferase
MRPRKAIKSIQPYKPGKPIEEVKRTLGLDEVYKLASNEVPFAPSYIRKAINKEISNVNRYPESSCFYVLKALSRKLGVNKSQIVFGNGSDELIVLALRAFVESGDKVIVAYPTFLIYEIQAKIQGARVIRVPLKNFQYCLDEMAVRVDKKTKIIFIANPDNPTGTYVNHSQVKKFLDKIPKDILVYFDEAYFEFAPRDFPKSLEFLKKRGNIIISRTFSKAYGLAGLRIGYCITTPSIAKIFNKIREPFNVNRLAQVAALAALKNRDFVRKVTGFVDSQKKALYAALDECGLEYIPSATNFILVDLKKDTKDLFDYLLEAGVIVRELRGWGLDTFFRVSVGTRRENIKFIRALKRYVAKK